MLCTTMCEISKITFLKKRYKHQIYAPKEEKLFRKELLHKSVLI